MRAFIAIEVESENLKKVQKEFDVEGIKLTSHFHITLKFFREISDELAEKVKEKLKEIKFEAFDIELEGVGVFPPEGNYIRVIWVGSKSEKLYELQKTIDEKLSDLFEKDTRFSGHITLGRVKFAPDKQLLLNKVENAKFESEKFTVKRFKFIKSVLETEGPAYEDLEVYDLE